MIIKHAKVFDVRQGFVEKDLIIEGQMIAAGCSDAQMLDAAGLYAIPGLVDVHQHGSLREDFATSDVEGINKMLSYQASNGVTAVCATTMTLSEEALTQAVTYIKNSGCPEGAAVAGINMEGPFFSPDKLGAQNPAYLKAPDRQMYQRLQEASGQLIKIVDVAPEMTGGLELIKQISGSVRCSLAHTAADYDTAAQAFENGARQVTHLYNAMPPFTHREPGVIGAAFDHKEVTPELICDGIHVHPSAIRVTFQMFGEDRLIMISDSMMATGLTDGMYELGGLPVRVEGNKATLTDGGNIAGSVTNLMNCVRYAVKNAGIPFYSAVKCASFNPARAIGADDKRGSLEIGKYADVVLMDEDLNIKKIFVRGREISPWRAE